jgi:hypothetical protein
MLLPANDQSFISTWLDKKLYNANVWFEVDISIVVEMNHYHVSKGMYS